jgi:hypothetical protein
MRVHAVTAALAFLLAASSADARPASSGPYAEFAVGGTSFIGEQSDNAALGLAGNIHIGLDLFSWFSIGGRVGLSSHEATVPPPPEGEYFQLYHAAAEARITIRHEWFAAFVSGSFGGALLSTNVLEKVDVVGPGERFASHVTAGGGIEYQLQNRHYAFGIAGEWAIMPGFARTQTANGRLYMRYTY